MEVVGAGQPWEHLFLKSSLSEGPLREGPGRSPITHSRAWEALCLRATAHGEQWEWTGGGRAGQTKALQGLPLAALPSSRCYYFLAPHSL